MRPSHNVRTLPAPVNDSDNTVTEPVGAVHPLPPEITNHPAWRETWEWLFERIATARRERDGEAA